MDEATWRQVQQIEKADWVQQSRITVSCGLLVDTAFFVMLCVKAEAFMDLYSAHSLLRFNTIMYYIPCFIYYPAFYFLFKRYQVTLSNYLRAAAVACGGVVAYLGL